MALIVGFPDISADPIPYAAQFDLAVTKILEQIGGVDGASLAHAGNLDSSNFAAGAGFRNEQKLEPKSIFAVAADALPTFTGYACNFNLPMDAELVAFGFCPDGTGLLQTYTVDLYVNDEKVRSESSAQAFSVANVPVMWDEQRLIGAGAHVKVVFTHTETGTITGLNVSFWFKALHRRV